MIAINLKEIPWKKKHWNLVCVHTGDGLGRLLCHSSLQDCCTLCARCPSCWRASERATERDRQGTGGSRNLQERGRASVVEQGHHVSSTRHFVLSRFCCCFGHRHLPVAKGCVGQPSNIGRWGFSSSSSPLLIYVVVLFLGYTLLLPVIPCLLFVCLLSFFLFAVQARNGIKSGNFVFVCFSFFASLWVPIIIFLCGRNFSCGTELLLLFWRRIVGGFG